jgi:hypothetical protein
VDCGRQVVAPLNMAQLVRQNRLQLGRRQALRNAIRQQQNRLDDSDNARFQTSG